MHAAMYSVGAYLYRLRPFAVQFTSSHTSMVGELWIPPHCITTILAYICASGYAFLQFLCLNASYNGILPATAALSELMVPCMGSLMSKSQCSRTRRLRPLPSFPTTSARGPVRLALS